MLTLLPYFHAFGHADLFALENLVTNFHMYDANSKLEVISPWFSNPNALDWNNS